MNYQHTIDMLNLLKENGKQLFFCTLCGQLYAENIRNLPLELIPKLIKPNKLSVLFVLFIVQ